MCDEIQHEREFTAILSTDSEWTGDESMQWYLSYSGKQVGPLNQEQARARVSANPNGYAWRDGFAEWLPIEKVRGRYYLRVTCEDQPGVLAKIADVFGRHQISISSVLQHDPHAKAAAGVPVVITTYEAVEGNIEKARKEIDGLDAVKADTVVIRIVEEHTEPEV